MNTCNLRCACLVLPMIALCASEAFALAVGYTPGHFSVTDSGQATYSIPLIVPPGTAGMQPSLSLNYNSGAGNGLLGQGWALGGLSQITRCPTTKAQDNVIDGVDFDALDRFCLDGQRLMTVGGHTYGANGAVYRTEIDTFSRIISYGVAGSGPAYFTVETRDGKIIEYGNTADSRIEAQGKTSARIWGVNKISDHAGNYMKFTYYEDSTNGEFRPVQIDYTGHEGTAPTLSPYAKVAFDYDAIRSDQLLVFGGGSQIKVTQRLTHIKTYIDNGATLVRDYRLTYGVSGINGASRLDNIQECDAAGNCFPPSRFTWEGNGSLPLFTTSISTPVWSDFSIITGDWNGDGRTDLFRQSKTGGTSYLYTANAQGYMIATGFNPTGWTGAIETGDWNGDGRTDMLRNYSVTDSCFYIWGSLACYYSYYATLYISNGAGMTSTGQTIYLGTTIGEITLTLKPFDWNGDGRTDAYSQLYETSEFIITNFPAVTPQPARVYTNNGSGALVDSGISFTTGVTHVGDWNGDSQSDVISVSGSQTQVYLSTGTNFVLAYTDTNSLLSGGGVVTGDYNGDGSTDIFLQGTITSYLYLSKGDGSFYNTGYNPTGWVGYKIITGDWNGDGKTDLGRLHSTNQQANFYYSTGTSMVTANYNPAWGGTKYVVTGDWNGDGLSDLWLSNSTAGQTTYQYKTTHSGFDLVKNFRDGLGLDTQVIYAALTEGSAAEGGIYTKTGLGSYPDLIVQTPMRVVDTVTVDDGNKAFRNVSYFYEDARMNLEGRGSLGFATVSMVDDASGLATITDYRQDFPYIGLPYQRDLQTGATLLSRVTTTYNQIENWTSEKVHFTYADLVETKRYELNGGALLATNTLDPTYDITGSPAQTPRTWGNPTQITETLTGGGDTFTTATTNVFNNTPATWLIGQLSRTTVTKTSVIPPEPTTSTTRVSAFQYHPTMGLLTREVIEPDIPSLRLQTDYEPDAFGNRKKITVSGADILTRETNLTYDPRGQFVDTVTNALDHPEDQDWNVKFGVLDQLTGPNDVITKWEYDGFGQRTKEYRAYLTPQQTTTDYSYKWCPGSPGDDGSSTTDWCDSAPESAYRVWTYTTGKPTTSDWYDSLGRRYLEAVWGFSCACWRMAYTFYDRVGNIQYKYLPYHDGNWTGLRQVYTYDALGRQRTETAPGNRVTTITYATTGGATPRAKKTIVNAEYQTSQEVYNARGELAQAIDAQNGQTNYIYDPYGNLKIVRSVSNLPVIGLTTIDLITNTYDTRGRKTASNDKDMGAWSYTYTVLDELKTQTNARYQTSTITYDKLGRMTSRIEPEGTAIWTWDTAVKGIGKIHTISSPEGKTETHAYDSVGRPSAVTTTIAGVNYTVSQSYDSAGRLEILTYPASIHYPAGLKVQQVYNANGYLSAVKNYSTGLVYWTQTAQDAEGHPTAASYGNGVASTWTYDPNTGFIDTLDSIKGATVIQDYQYDFDKLGNLKRRDNFRANAYEIFNYDALNRLDDASTTAGGQTLNRDYQYDALGNLTFKDGIGSYAYTYSGRPHAPTSIGAKAQTYDADGNQTAGWNFSLGQVRTQAYTTYDKSWKIIQGNTNLFFDHDAGRDRFRQVRQVNGVNMETIYYVGQGLYEKRIAGSVVTHTHYIQAGGHLVAIYQSKTGTSGETLRYVHTDSLGSLTEFTNETGTLDVAETLGYDAWGRRRDPDWDNTPYTPPATLATKRGYTGHEHLDDAGLIHMNGRVYDPDSGRFLSADPFISKPTNSQSYNRYSYVLNNPLSYTDPSGFAGVPGCPTCDDEVWVPGHRPSPGLSLGWSGDGSSSGPYSSASFGFGYASPAEGKRGTPSASNDTCSDQQQPGGEEIEEITVIGHPPSKYKYSFALRFSGMAAATAGNDGAHEQEPECQASGTAPISAQGGVQQSTVINYSDNSIETRFGGTRSWRNNNPGNLILSPFSTRHGAIGSAGGFAVFPNESVGTDAQLSLLQGPTYQALTINEAIKRWSTTDQGTYQVLVQEALGVKGDTPLSSLSDTQINNLGRVQRRIEGWRIGAVYYTCRPN